MISKVPLAGRLMPVLSLVLAFFVGFIAAGAPTSTSMLLIGFLLLQLLIGRILVGFVDPAIVKESWLHNIVGFAVGSAFTSVSDVIFRNSSFSMFAWLIPALPCVGIVMFQRQIHSGRTGSEVGSGEVVLVMGIASVVLGVAYGWQLPLGFAVVAIIGILQLSKSEHLNRFKISIRTGSLAAFALVMVSVGAIRIRSRDSLWWTVNSDITFTEGASRSIGTWGLGDHLAAVGQLSLSKYHWLPFAWNGLASRVSGAETWLISTRVAQVVVVYCTVGLFWWLVRHLLHATYGRSVVATVAGSVAAISVGANFTLMVGIFWLLSIACYVIHSTSNQFRSNEIWMIFLLTTGLSMIKPQLAVLVAAGFLLMFLAVALTNFHFDRRWAMLSTSSFVAGLFVLVIQRTLSGSDTTQSAGIYLDLVSVGSFNELGNLRNIFAVPLSGFILGGVIALPVVLAILAKRIESARSVIATSLVLLVVSVAVLYSIDAIYSYLAIYMYSAIWIVTGLLLAVVVGKASVPSPFSRTLLLAGVLVALMSATVNSAWERLFDPAPTGNVRDVFMRKLADSPWIPLVLGVVLTWLLWARTVRPEKVHARSALTALLALGLLNPISVIGSAADRLLNGVRVDPASTEQFFAFSDDLGPLIETVEFSSTKSEIFASNAFCPYDAKSLCGEPNWWSNFIESNESDSESARCHGQEHFAIDWSLPAVTNRRFLIQGPQMFVGCGDVPDWLTERVRISEEFARNGDSTSFNELCEKDVGWFIVDTLVTKRDSWVPYGEPIAKTSRFRLLKLNESLCAVQPKEETAD